MERRRTSPVPTQPTALDMLLASSFDRRHALKLAAAATIVHPDIKDLSGLPQTDRFGFPMNKRLVYEALETQDIITASIISDGGTATDASNNVALAATTHQPPDLIVLPGDLNYDDDDYRHINSQYSQYQNRMGEDRILAAPGDWDIKHGRKKFGQNFGGTHKGLNYRAKAGSVEFFVMDGPEALNNPELYAYWLQVGVHHSLQDPSVLFRFLVEQFPPDSSGHHAGHYTQLQPLAYIPGLDGGFFGDNHSQETLLYNKQHVQGLDKEHYTGTFLSTINGMGGRTLTENTPIPHPFTINRFDGHTGDYGFTRLTVHKPTKSATISYVTHTGTIMDSYTLTKEAPGQILLAKN